jgi:hypothetical protein
MGAISPPSKPVKIADDGLEEKVMGQSRIFLGARAIADIINL